MSADHIFYAPTATVADIASPDLKEEFFTRDLPYGVLEFKQWYFEGIRIRYTRNFYHDHYLFENRNELNVVSLEFNLKGNYEIYHHGQQYTVRSRQHNIIYTPGVHNTFKNQDLQGETFVIEFLPDVFLRIIKDSNETLKRFAEKMMEGNPVVIARSSPLLTPELSRLIGEILQCRFTGGLKKIFLLSKVMEILVMQAEIFDKAALGEKNDFKVQGDQDRILFAKEYLVSHIINPPSLSALSKIAGVNEYKLKKGFREIFQTTVFGYLSDHRLTLAQEELKHTEKSISEIAYDLGYSSPQHFSNAFKKKFGVPPRTAKR